MIRRSRRTPTLYYFLLQPSKTETVRTKLTGQVEENGLGKYTGQYYLLGFQVVLKQLSQKGLSQDPEVGT